MPNVTLAQGDDLWMPRFYRCAFLHHWLLTNQYPSSVFLHSRVDLARVLVIIVPINNMSNGPVNKDSHLASISCDIVTVDSFSAIWAEIRVNNYKCGPQKTRLLTRIPKLVLLTFHLFRVAFLLSWKYSCQLNYCISSIIRVCSSLSGRYSTGTI